MAEPLDVPARIRPWLKSGLAFVLTESQEEAQALRRASPSESSSETRNYAVPRRGDDRPDSTRQAPSGPGAAPHPSRPPRPARPSSRPGPARPAPPSETVEATGLAERTGAMLPSMGGALPVTEWPAPWQALYRRRPLPEHPMVIWTYGGLGEDLMGRPDAARQQVIVRMLKALQHPAGTHVFWPLAIPDWRDAVGGPSLFWSGEAHLRPRVLLVFGEDAARDIGLDKSLSLFRVEAVRGRRVVLLPTPLELAGDESAFSRSFAFLSRLLNFCAGSGR